MSATYTTTAFGVYDTTTIARGGTLLATHERPDDAHADAASRVGNSTWTVMYEVWNFGPCANTDTIQVRRVPHG